MGKKVSISGLVPGGATLHTPPQGQIAGSLWLGRTSCSFASDWAGPRGCAKEETSERQDWEAKIRWERDWQ